MKLSHVFAFLGIFVFYMGYTHFQEERKKIYNNTEGEEKVDKIKELKDSIVPDRPTPMKKAEETVIAMRQEADVRAMLGWQRLYAAQYTDIRARYAKILNEHDPRSPLSVTNVSETSDFTALVKALDDREKRASKAYKDMPPKIKAAETERDSTSKERHAQWLQDNKKVDATLEDTDKSESTLTGTQQVGRTDVQVKDQQIHSLERELKRQKDTWARVVMSWEKKVKEWEERLLQCKRRIEEKKKRVDPSPRGQIVEADVRQGWAVINLGKAHGLKEGFVFKVMRPIKGGLGRFVGDVRVQDAQELVSFCKLWHASATDPPMPRDLIYNELWQPGATFTYTFVGAFDLLGPYNNKETEIIAKFYGNDIRERLDEDVSYMVLGPPRNPNDPKEMEAIEDAMFRARELQVEILSAKKFLQWIGYYDFDRVWKEEQRVKTQQDVRQFHGRPTPASTPVPTLQE